MPYMKRKRDRYCPMGVRNYAFSPTGEIIMSSVFMITAQTVCIGTLLLPPQSDEKGPRGVVTNTTETLV